MNGQPHLHRIEILHSMIVYGDTRIDYFRWFGRDPSERRLRRLVHKAVSEHDRGSLAAVEQQALKNRITEPINSRAYHDDGDVWGTELLKEQS